MTQKEKIIQYKREHPNATYAEIGKLFDRAHSSVREALNPSVARTKNDQKRKSLFQKRCNLILEYGGKCSRCGYCRYLGVLEFHHLNPEEKKFNVTKWNLSIEKLREEAEKCVLLCPTCHAETHFEQR